jgi:hypothetical protein
VPKKRLSGDLWSVRFSLISLLPATSTTVNSVLIAVKPGIDTKCCSACAHTRLISSFLKDTSAAPNSRVFALCIPCHEVKRRSASKRKASRQLAPDHPPILPDTPMPINMRVETSMPIEIPIPPPLPAHARPESRLQPSPP